MSIHVSLRHVTTYRYDRPVNLGPHVVRLRPAPHARTPIVSYSLKVEPAQHFINWQQDPQSNYLARLVFNEKTTELKVAVEVVAEMSVFNPFDFFLEPAAERFPFTYDHVLDHELEPFQLKTPLTAKFGEYLRVVKQRLLPSKLPDVITEKNDPRPRTLDFLVSLNQMVQKDIKYLVRLDPGVQTPEETLTTGSGSCRDSAWLLCQLFRRLGLASRFVSGYLIQLKPDQTSLDGPSGAEQDFTDLHAWTEVYLPGAGWVGLDPTSGLLAGEGHIPLAATPDPQSAAPISGLIDECEVEFDFEMSVTRIHESPRVTKPYTEEQWAKIEALGHKIDAEMDVGDMRLTMGGEPTFVSVDDPDGEEWNTGAVGPAKRVLSDRLLRRLRDKFAPGALLFHGIGKWYPGEQLPRYALACHWRKDGVPLWHDKDLIADESRNYGHTAEDARRFGQTLAANLGIDTKWLQPGYEDIFYYLWKERRLPSNVDPLNSKLKDPLERARIARLFEQGLDQLVGFALPLKRQWEGNELKWKSGPWFLRDDRLWLIPGDSPMGLRLPLESLPWVAPTEYPWIVPHDPMSDLPPLTSRMGVRKVSTNAPDGSVTPAEALRGQGPAEKRADTPPPPAPAPRQSAPWVIRTALCIEARDGRLHIFLPPVSHTEDCLDLVAAIEKTAAELDLPVILEGTAPPHDPRLNVFRVTPDPGVIEVNLHPAHSWDELVSNTTTLYEEARQSRLTTEKFMVDGRHTGTGGGNHIVMGGETPSDSPFLRRPDLLRSLLTYWHNHPSLSYLFSGLFIGPTSQSPRVDEARNDSLYELELAFKQIPEKGPVPPWLVDRIFRNLLVDCTGNTHRTEFSIDKLYSPDGPTGRLGLIELRSMEMPPHARMSLAQQLLVRATLARFWKEPTKMPLVRWGTELHDRFLLPHFVWADFLDVMADMNQAGYPLEAEWFAPHFEFRFPVIGEIARRNVHLEIRSALEPWHVLGEEGSPGGTVRFVDSSLERVQLRTRGLVEGRHVVTCNGVNVPLHPTGTVGEFVAGVRYRAWQPPNCLQPTIGIHTPLIFDVVDTWSNRSIGGCTYHVAHPGGRNHTSFPVNAYEAESRRLSRFFAHGHSQGPRDAKPLPRLKEFPFTLDLRQS